MDAFVLTPEILAAIAAAVLSLLFSYIPKLNVWFASLAQEVKRLSMAGLLLLISAAIFGLGCAGIVNSGISCDQAGLIRLITIFIIAIMANQSVYQLTPIPEKVRDAAINSARLARYTEGPG